MPQAPAVWLTVNLDHQAAGRMSEHVIEELHFHRASSVDRHGGAGEDRPVPRVVGRRYRRTTIAGRFYIGVVSFACCGSHLVMPKDREINGKVAALRPVNHKVRVCITCLQYKF